MSTKTADHPDDRSLLAAEYVLRLLLPSEERAFERRLLTERPLLAEVAEWTTRFSGMDAEVADAAPRRRVKAALQARLFGAEKSTSLASRIWLWKGLSAASIAMVGLLAFQVIQTPQPSLPSIQRGPLYVSEVAATDQSLRILAVYDADARQLMITRTAGAAAEGRALELWAIAEGSAPVSLGVLPDRTKTGIAIPAALHAQIAGLTLAISDEPLGGSTTGGPTGAVLAMGQVTDL
ncbi:anti-sigma factor [Roseovarius arcticus]|uniref:anti-sigma factor n=1 Tax=Roseovarius arcticus TaxID=2547404 RepID=UPI00148654FD|nr:anti-sigma factor [Roseovarius arcticus]